MKVLITGYLTRVATLISHWLMMMMMMMLIYVLIYSRDDLIVLGFSTLKGELHNLV